MTMHNLSAVIYGCQGLELTDEERVFFEDQQPVGFILFARNCDNPEQIKALTQELRSCVEHQQVPILIDQEGGRVARLKPPHWRDYPPAQVFSDLAKDKQEEAERACYVNARLMADELTALGINTNCAPVADLRLDDAHDIIGDRAFGNDVHSIVPLANAQAQGLMDGGVIPVLKHIPGHGRALVDSHESLPTVKESMEVMEQTDFPPFKTLSYLPMGMTAHICYEALDPDCPATLSKKAISYIRDTIGFDGLLMTDDLSMKALKGDLGELATAALDAGCDVVLHCNGEMAEMREVAKGTYPLSSSSFERLEDAFDVISHAEPLENSASLEEERQRLLAMQDAA